VKKIIESSRDGVAAGQTALQFKIGAEQPLKFARNSASVTLEPRMKVFWNMMT
jgi:hypothetical protein